MLEQNDTSERMLILLDAIIEAKDNSKVFLRTIHALQTSTQRVNRSTRDTPRTLNSFFLQKVSCFRTTEVYFYLDVVSVYPCRVPLKAVSSSTGPVYGAHPTPASASGRHKLRTMCNETCLGNTFLNTPQKKMWVIKCGAKRVNICVRFGSQKETSVACSCDANGCPPGEPSTRETFLCQCNTSRQA